MTKIIDEWYNSLERVTITPEVDPYDQGAVDSYYGRPSSPNEKYSVSERDQYWLGYAQQPYGTKDNGYE